MRIERAGGNAVIYKYASSQAAVFVKVRYGDAGGMWSSEVSLRSFALRPLCECCLHCNCWSEQRLPCVA